MGTDLPCLKFLIRLPDLSSVFVGVPSKGIGKLSLKYISTALSKTSKTNMSASYCFSLSYIAIDPA